jgi:hypothetical protein
VLAEGPAQQLLQAGDDVVEAERLGVHHIAAGEDQQLAGQPDRPLRRIADLLDIAEHAAQPRVLARQAAYLLRDHVAKARDHVQQVIEVMRDTADQLAQALHPLGLPQPVLRRRPLRISTFHIAHQPSVIDSLGTPLSQVSTQLKVSLVVWLFGHVTEDNEHAEGRARRDQRRNDQTAYFGASDYIASVVRQPGAGGIEPRHQDRLTGSQRLTANGAGYGQRAPEHGIFVRLRAEGVVVVRRGGQQELTRRVEQPDVAAVTQGLCRFRRHLVEDHVQVQARAEQLAGLSDHREPPALCGGEGQCLAQRLLITVLARPVRYPQGPGTALQRDSQPGRLEQELGAVLPLVQQRAGPPSLVGDEGGKAFPAQAGHGTWLARDVGDRLPQCPRSRYAEQVGSRAVPGHDLLVLVNEDHREPGRARDRFNVNRVPAPPRTMIPASHTLQPPYEPHRPEAASADNKACFLSSLRYTRCAAGQGMPVRRARGVRVGLTAHGSGRGHLDARDLSQRCSS